MSEISSNEVIIAAIGAIGVIATAVFSNWDKMFPKPNVIKTTFSGYQATGDFETELRYFFEVSGTRKALEAQTEQVLQNYRIQLLRENPEGGREINEIIDAIEEEAITVDEAIKKMLPAYKDNLTVEEVQEMNKFYSSKIMQSMTKKLEGLAQDVAPLQIELQQDYQRRIDERIQRIYEKIEGRSE